MYYSVIFCILYTFPIKKGQQKRQEMTTKKNMRSYKQADRKSYQILVKFVTAQDTKASDFFLS